MYDVNKSTDSSTQDGATSSASSGLTRLSEKELINFSIHHILLVNASIRFDLTFAR